MPNITINGNSHTVEDGLTLIQVCDMFDISIPRFCYHEKLPPVGSCRMCLIELKGSNKLIPACTTSVSDGMEIITDNPAIDTARKTMLELLLTNHPLDCPICDKGGECDLQDQTYRYGYDRSSFNVEKRAIPQKDFGPLIDSYMTRCIHCSRCIRFAKEIAGVEELGSIGKGEFTEINTYVGKSLTSELSGNVADVCPVGALTHSNYSYKARPWELISTETIDIMDAVGSNTKVDSSPLAVLRIMPKLNEDINEEWLGDKSRYITDALRTQRLDTPMIRIEGKLESVTWDAAFAEIKANISKLRPEEISAISGDFADLESIYALKLLMQALKVKNLDCRTNLIDLDPKDTSSYLFNTTIVGIEASDSCLIIGSNPRFEAPLLNARIRKRYLQGSYKIALIGEREDLNYKYDFLGENSSILQEILDGTHQYCQTLRDSKNPMLILGLGALQTENSLNLINTCKKIALKYNMVRDDWNGYNVLQTSTGLLNGLILGFTPEDNMNIPVILERAVNDTIKFIWLMNVDNINFSRLKKNTFVVYQGHHGDKGASIANVVLPGALWLEKDATYINLEGRVQIARKCVPLVGDAREDWKIIRRFAEIIGKDLGFNTLEDLREKLRQNYPFIKENKLIKVDFQAPASTVSKLSGKTFKNIIDNYYITDVISKNSLKMLECTKLFKRIS